MNNNQNQNNNNQNPNGNGNRPKKPGLTGTIIILIISVIVFFMTEDLSGIMVIRDRWTGLMILIAAAALIVDFICLRYRGILPEETENSEEE